MLACRSNLHWKLIVIMSGSLRSHGWFVTSLDVAYYNNWSRPVAFGNVYLSMPEMGIDGMRWTNRGYLCIVAYNKQRMNKPLIGQTCSRTCPWLIAANVVGQFALTVGGKAIIRLPRICHLDHDRGYVTPTWRWWLDRRSLSCLRCFGLRYIYSYLTYSPRRIDIPLYTDVHDSSEPADIEDRACYTIVLTTM